MRISDWSSDVCSSDLQFGDVARRDALQCRQRQLVAIVLEGVAIDVQTFGVPVDAMLGRAPRAFREQLIAGDRKSVVSGKSVSVRVDLGGRRIIKKKIIY